MPGNDPGLGHADSPPRIKAFLLCDQAIQDTRSRKWSIIGVFSKFEAPDFPAIIPRFFIFVKCDIAVEKSLEFQVVFGRAREGDAGEHVDVGTLVVRGEPTTRGKSFEAGVEVNGMPLPAAGNYVARLRIFGEEQTLTFEAGKTTKEGRA